MYLSNSVCQVYAALYEFMSGIHRELSFSGNTFIKAYTAHVGLLEKLKAKKPTEFHEVMSKLYKLVVFVLPYFFLLALC
jgi:dsDNA-specific endonuclease/ATPase MutS2